MKLIVALAGIAAVGMVITVLVILPAQQALDNSLIRFPAAFKVAP